MTLNWAHTHLLLNHFPIVGAFFGLLLLLYAVVKRSDDLKRASYWTFVIITLIAIAKRLAKSEIAVYYSGTQASAVVSGLPGVRGEIIHRHRQVAEWSLIAIEILGALSLVGLLFLRSKRAINLFVVVISIMAIATTGLVSWAGLQGGIIRHTEVRGDLPFLVPAKTESESGGHSESEAGHSH